MLIKLESMEKNKSKKKADLNKMFDIWGGEGEGDQYDDDDDHDNDHDDEHDDMTMKKLTSTRCLIFGEEKEKVIDMMLMMMMVMMAVMTV